MRGVGHGRALARMIESRQSQRNDNRRPDNPPIQPCNFTPALRMGRKAMWMRFQLSLMHEVPSKAAAGDPKLPSGIASAVFIAIFGLAQRPLDSGVVESSPPGPGPKTVQVSCLELSLGRM